MKVTVFDDRSALMHAAAERVIEIATQAIAARGELYWALAGGSTPEALYRLLTTPQHAERIDWGRVHFFWSDERCVPPDDVRSNYRMARTSLLDWVRPKPGNVHRLLGELEPSVAAEHYERELERAFELSRERSSERPAASLPSFDLLLLGMGQDGHTASLFPGSPALEERERWVVATSAPDGAPRLTFTLPLLNAAAHVVFLVAGADKAARLRDVVAPARPEHADRLPARLVRPSAAPAEWLVDSAAASVLARGT